MPDFVGRLQAALADKYQIERELGRGGAALVFLARDLRHNRPVAIKALRPELAVSIGAERFLREIEIAASLQHPHVVPLHDSGQADGLLYYVMPYVVGESLRELLEREKQLQVDEAVRYTGQIADALGYAHSKGLIHRDIKPENILISNGWVMVADFGIARALTEAGGERLTSSGVTVGTPAYMSPEQATASQELDARSDIYSLACVVHEMIAGEPPFLGRTAQSIIARHVSEAPPSLSVMRPTVSPDFAAVIDRALAKNPVDRYASAQEFREAVEAPPRISVARQMLDVGSFRWIGWIAIAAIFAFFFVGPPISFGESRSMSRYAVMPCNITASDIALSAAECQIRLIDALTEWEDVDVVPLVRVLDAVQQATDGGERFDLSAAAQSARNLDAGVFIQPTVQDFGDSLQVRATLMRSENGREQGRESHISLLKLSSVEQRSAAFVKLANSLVRERAGASAASSGPPGTRVLGAYRLYARGYGALFSRWDLDAARSAFDSALQLDPNYTQAQLWLAQTMWLANDSLHQWRRHAQAAVASVDRLHGPKERDFARALMFLADSAYYEACGHYRAIVERDTTDTDPIAWFGLGECLSKDARVVSDTTSPSGYHFRSSRWSAVEAYRRALTDVPSFNFALESPVYAKLADKFFARANAIRMGRLGSPEADMYAAFASWQGDSIAFIPHRADDVFSRVPGAEPPAESQRRALQRSREILAEIVSNWARAFPTSAEAHTARALALETLGRMNDALRAVEDAQDVAGDSDEEFDPVFVRIRLLVKMGRFEDAVDLADELLSKWPTATPVRAVNLAGLAALTGRADLAAEFLSSASRYRYHDHDFPLIRGLRYETLQLTDRLLAYAALGAPMDSVRVLSQRAEQQLVAFEGERLADQVRPFLFNRAFQMTFAVLDSVGSVHYSPPDPSSLLILQRQLYEGKQDSVRASLLPLHEARADDQWPGTLSIDAAYLESLLLLALGDSARAVSQLDRALNALRLSGVGLLEMGQAATLIRAMALRAELAASQHDARSARLWAGPVTILWRNADEELQKVVQSMKVLNRS